MIDFATLSCKFTAGHSPMHAQCGHVDWQACVKLLRKLMCARMMCRAIVCHASVLTVCWLILVALFPRVQSCPLHSQQHGPAQMVPQQEWCAYSPARSGNIACAVCRHGAESLLLHEHAIQSTCRVCSQRQKASHFSLTYGACTSMQVATQAANSSRRNVGVLFVHTRWA